MCMRNHRVLVEDCITPMEWAVMSATSYFLPLSPTQLVIHALLESEDDFSSDEIKYAALNCMRHGWLSQSRDGITLTEEGRQIKDRVNQELIETVELL